MILEEKKEEISHSTYLLRDLDLVASWQIPRELIFQRIKLSQGYLVKEIIKKKKELINNYDQDLRLIPVHSDSRIRQETKLKKFQNQSKIKEDSNQNSLMLIDWSNQISSD